MISLEDDELTFRFPDIHPRAVCEIAFRRTLRIPDDNREYPLPPDFGRFPLHHVDDYAHRLPSAWQMHGGVFLPMHQSEAVWLDFHALYPMAIKVAAGKVNVLTGQEWTRDLCAEPQDYLVVPSQPWLDGFCVAEGTIRQFVAMPLGAGFTAEEQLAGASQHGGLQIIAYPMRGDVYRERYQCTRAVREDASARDDQEPLSEVQDMGIAPGGLMRQRIYEDAEGLDAWDTSTCSRCFAHLLNSQQFFSIAGVEPPTMPPTAKNYSDAGLPWFDYYDGDRAALKGAKKLAGMHSLAAKSWQAGVGPVAGNEAANPQVVKTLTGRPVREGETF